MSTRARRRLGQRLGHHLANARRPIGGRVEGQGHAVIDVGAVDRVGSPREQVDPFRLEPPQAEFYRAGPALRIPVAGPVIVVDAHALLAEVLGALWRGS